MSLDQAQLDLFTVNLRAAYRAGVLLATSLRRLAHDIPLDSDHLDALNDNIKEKLDAFRVRFGDLQDLLGAKVFRSLLVLEQEKIGSQLDILNQADKRGLIPSLESWIEIRTLRNGFAHDYPEHEKERIDALNQAFGRAIELLLTLDNVIAYAHHHFATKRDEFEALAPKVKIL